MTKALPRKIGSYYILAKPGIIYGNAINALGGFFLASQGHVNIGLFLATMLGSSLVVASGCVANNYLDRAIDAKMARTKKRPLITGEISPTAALLYAAILGLLGFGLLALYTNLLTVGIGVLGWIGYVIIYGYTKRRTVYGTEIGSLAGAVPPLAAYTAVSGRFDTGAFLVFLVFALWQMPHFYGITMYRLNDYKEAGIPVLSIVKGMERTKNQTIVYLLLFALSTTLFTIYGYTGYIFLIVMGIVSFTWLFQSMRARNTMGDAVWGRHVFRFSLVVVLVLSLMISIGHLLP